MVDGNGKRAHSYVVGTCGDNSCRAAHVWLFEDDRREQPFASMTIAMEHIPMVAKKLQDIAYEIATRGT